MVLFAVAALLLPVALAGSVGYQVPISWSGWQNSGWSGNSGWGNSGWGVQNQQQQQQHHEQEQHQGNWWGLNNQEDYEAYLRWCEERKLAMQEQEQQKHLLEQIEQRAEVKKQEMAREKASKELQMKRETMMNQWRMWNAQLMMADEFDGNLGKYTTAKIGYMFHLTMDFLKFCHCSDYTGHLERWLVHEGKTYEAGQSDAYNLDELDSFEIGDVDAVAQRLAALSDAEQVKLYFGGIIKSMCGSVRTYVDQVKIWEGQYNFMGMDMNME